jgi:antitoxin CcdA
MRMKQERITAMRRRGTNVSLDAELVAEARALGVNVSRACEQGLADQVKAARAEQWQRENADAIAEWNTYVEVNGLPLARYRQF